MILLETIVTATRPFDDIRDLLRKMPKADEAAK